MRRKHKRVGQALVEFALFITLIFTVLSAVIDLGIAFFAYQGLAGAAQEGASYGALYPTYIVSGTTTNNDTEIRKRAAYEGGAGPATERSSFVDLLDLNNDDIVDTDTIRTSWVTISQTYSLAYTTALSKPTLTCGRTKEWCDIIVTVSYNYKPIFALAATLGLSQITLRAQRQMLISR